LGAKGRWFESSISDQLEGAYAQTPPLYILYV